MRVSVHLLLVAIGCLACSWLGACRGYQPGTLTPQAEGEVRTVGCLDVAVSPVRDSAAVGPVAGITFANRCDAAVRVELGAIRAVGEFYAGQRQPMALFDPNREVGPGMIEARAIARELLEYQLPADPSSLPARLCLDLSGIDPSAALDRPVIACIDGGAVGPLAQVTR